MYICGIFPHCWDYSEATGTSALFTVLLDRGKMDLTFTGEINEVNHLKYF